MRKASYRSKLALLHRINSLRSDSIRCGRYASLIPVDSPSEYPLDAIGGF
jgi:hypothetical protein